MYRILHITVEYFGSSSHQESKNREARINDKLRVISYNRAYIEYSSGKKCHSFFFISTSKLR